MTQQRRKYTDKPDSRFTESLNFDERASTVRTTYEVFRREWDICYNHERSIPVGKAHSWKLQMRLSQRKCSFVSFTVCHFCRKCSFVDSIICHFCRKCSFMKYINVFLLPKRLICGNYIRVISNENPSLCDSHMIYFDRKASYVEDKHQSYPSNSITYYKNN